MDLRATTFLVSGLTAEARLLRTNLVDEVGRDAFGRKARITIGETLGPNSDSLAGPADERIDHCEIILRATH